MHAGKLLMKKLSNPKKHFLFTFVIDQSTHVHGYIMCTDKRYVEPAIDRAIGQCEQEGIRFLFPMILLTELSTDHAAVELVRRVVCEYPKAKKVLNKAKDFHLSVWAMSTDNPYDSQLMALH